MLFFDKKKAKIYVKNFAIFIRGKGYFTSPNVKYDWNDRNYSKRKIMNYDWSVSLAY